MKIIYILIACILLASCQKEETLPTGNSTKGPLLTFIKAMSNGEKIIQGEFQYNPDGSIKSALIYKDYKAGLIGSKKVYQYQNAMLKSILAEMDYSSSSSSVNYTFSKTEFEYDNDNTIIQSNNFRKENNDYKFASFLTYAYNEKKLPVKISRYVAEGSLIGYSTYTYDGKGNVVQCEEYQINTAGEPVKKFQRTYQYDNKINPYKNAYQLLENIPYSVNQNNIISSAWTNYAVNPQGDSGSSITKYNMYNDLGYPTEMDEQGNVFSFEYK